MRMATASAVALAALRHAASSGGIPWRGMFTRRCILSSPGIRAHTWKSFAFLPSRNDEVWRLKQQGSKRGWRPPLLQSGASVSSDSNQNFPNFSPNDGFDPDDLPRNGGGMEDEGAPPFSMDPRSSEARSLVTQTLGLSEDQYDRLIHLSGLVVEWNDKINLISRSDCSEAVVFGRHIVPSLALLPLLRDAGSQLQIVDVGTGGGFPGLPLAVALEDASFLLVDSVGKKLKVVDAMTEELGLSERVQTRHGRAEYLVDEDEHLEQAFDVCLGRSVASVPQMCAWVQDLVGEKLFYIVGGEVEEYVQAKVVQDVPLVDLLQSSRDVSDKRVLVLDREAVVQIAAESGIKKRKVGTPSIGGKKKSTATGRRWKLAKGQWRKKTDEPKQRGYENFKRYNFGGPAPSKQEDA